MAIEQFVITHHEEIRDYDCQVRRLYLILFDRSP
jgi:hypothetical protein